MNYIVLGARRVQATFPDGRQLEAKVAAQDFETGLAILRIPSPDLRTAVMGDSRRLSRGQETFILASAGPTERRASGGVVTDLGPFDAYWEYMLESAIQTSAANPGFGGGPLFDLRGRLMGITSLSLGQMGRMSLAIPIHLYAERGADLLRFGRMPGRPPRAWVGVYPEPAATGVVVIGVVPNAPADRAGLREGDVILAVNSCEVATRSELYRELWRQPAGTLVRLGLLRGNERLTVEVESVDRAEFYR